MNTYKKVIKAIVLVTMFIPLIAMENDNANNSIEQNKSIERKSSQPLNIVKQASSKLVLDESPSSTQTTPISYLPSISYVTSVVSNSFESLKNTVNNRLWDESAFEKLGWPPNDKKARKELKNTQKIYKRLDEYFSTHIMYDKFDDDDKAVERREQYCQRVLDALPHHPDAVNLALFCMEKHQFAMLYRFRKFKFFLEIEQQKSKQTAEKVEEKLAQLIDSYRSELDESKKDEKK